MSGLIWSALGQGIANAGATVGGMLLKRADEEEKRAWQERLMKLEEEKQLRVDAIRRQRDVEGIGATAAATAAAALQNAPIVARAGVATEATRLEEEEKQGLPAKRAQATATAEAQRIQALVDKGVPEAQAKLQVQQETARLDEEKKQGLIARRAEVALDTQRAGKPARDELAAEGTKNEMNKVKDQAGDPAFVKAVKTLTDAKESSAAKAQAAAAMFDLDQKKLVANYRRVLENEADPEARKQIQQQIQDLSGGSSKSFGDVVTAGNAFRMMANNLRDQLKNDPPSTDAELNDIKQRIKLYEQQAAEILGAAVDRRMGPGTVRASETRAPYPDGTELKGPDGKTYVVRNGVPVLKTQQPAATSGNPTSWRNPMSPEE